MGHAPTSLKLARDRFPTGLDFRLTGVEPAQVAKAILA